MTVLERTNVRRRRRRTIGGPVDVVVVDLSFISLARVIPVLVALCQPGSPMVLLVKPQFEAGRVEVARGRGVITDPAIHDRVRDEVDAAAGRRPAAPSPAGSTRRSSAAKGNRELLVHAVTPGAVVQ